jgi:hypothetical protein
MVVVLIGVLINNNRIGDLRADVGTRLNDLRTDIRELFVAQSKANDANLRRVEDMLLGKFAELDTRLSRIESHLNLH